jgi:hypothetical protein
MEPKVEHRSYILRGYVEQVEQDDFFGMCLTINVTSRGRSLEEATAKLNEAVRFYVMDAARDKQLDEWLPRRAPLYFYWRYLVLRIRMMGHFFLPAYDAQLMRRVIHA